MSEVRTGQETELILNVINVRDEMKLAHLSAQPTARPKLITNPRHL